MEHILKNLTQFPSWCWVEYNEPELHLKDLTKLVKNYAERTDRSYSEVINLLIDDGRKSNYD